MIGYLEGTLKQLDATRALVMAGGVGYDVHISLQTYYRLEGRRDAALEIYAVGLAVALVGATLCFLFYGRDRDVEPAAA